MSEEKKRDALADALAALAAGEHHEEPHPDGSGIDAHVHEAAPPVAPPAPAARRPGPPAPPAMGGAPKPVARTGAPVPRQATPPTPAQSAARPPTAAASKPRSAAPGAPTTAAARPSAPGAPAGPPRPRAAAPGVPAAPASPKASVPLRPASPNSKARPAAPAAGGTPSAARPPAAASSPPPPARRAVAPPPAPVEQFVDEPTAEEQALAHEAEVAAEAEAVAHVVEDDDTLNMPAPSAESLAHRPPRPRAQKELMSRTAGFKQTLIPILLTMGVLLPAIAGYSMFLGEESPMATATWIPMLLMGMGVVMLVFAVVTMLQVKNQLDKQARP